jgi:hypothetical protein
VAATKENLGLIPTAKKEPAMSEIDYFTSLRKRLPNRRNSTTFNLEVAGLKYTATVSFFADGKVGELFLSNHKSNSGADTNARDSAIAFSFAVQHGADPEAIRRALCRDFRGNASGPLAAALDAIFAAEAKL